MKILHIAHSIAPEKGGVSRSLSLISKSQIEQGHAVEIATLDNQATINNLPVHCPIHALGKQDTHYGYSKNFQHWLTENIIRFDTAIIHGIWQYHSFTGARISQQRKIPYYVRPAGMLDPWFKKAYKLKHIKKQLYWLLREQFTFKNANAAIFTAKLEQSLAKGTFFPYKAKKEIIFTMGTTPPPIPKEKAVASFIQNYTALKNKPFMLCMSRIHPKKGMDLAIKAFQSTNLERDIHLVIAGPCEEPPYLNYLQKLANKDSRIHFLPMLSGENKWGALFGADAFILPSHQENFGIVVPEALACETPVLISDKINIYQEILSAQAGFVSNDTLEGTIRLMQNWVQLNLTDKKKLRSNAKTCFASYFDIRHNTEKLMHFIQEDISNAPRN